MTLYVVPAGTSFYLNGRKTRMQQQAEYEETQIVDRSKSWVTFSTNGTNAIMVATKDIQEI